MGICDTPRLARNVVIQLGAHLTRIASLSGVR
jgi:hypothetical protein